jgi:electron transfer flavoprotein beta subunit
MEVITCIKRVPDIPDFVKIDAPGKDIQRDGLMFKINDWDEYVVETALQIKEKLGGSFTAVTVGTEECEDILRRALALGADKAIRINEDVTSADSLVIAKILSTLISRLPHDLVLFGMQSEDWGRGQLGPMTAEMLNLPHAVGVKSLEVRDREIKVGRELEGGTIELYTLKLPALVTIQSGINQPRYPSVLGIRRAKQKELNVMTLGELDLSQEQLVPMLRLENLALPSEGKEVEVLSGSAEEVADKLVNILKGLGVL